MSQHAGVPGTGTADAAGLGTATVGAADPGGGATKSTPWLVQRPSHTPAPATLYCFPPAGGSASEYARWPEGLPEVQVAAVALPGRGARRAEAPFTRMAALVEAIVADVAFRPPFALFGHSLGGLIAYEVAAALTERGAGAAALFLSSCPPPPAAGSRRRTLVHELGDEEFLAEVQRRWGPLPPAVANNRTLREIVLRSYRADIAVFESYRNSGHPPLSCPVTVTAGTAERADFDLESWAGLTRGRFSLQYLPGGHFYLREQREPLLALLRERLPAVTAPYAATTRPS